MPAVSGSPTQMQTSQPDVAALESVEIDQFKSGDLAFLAGPPPGGGPYYYLDLTSGAARDGVNVLYTRNSNPGYNAAIGVGRWLRLNITAAGSPDEILAEDVTYLADIHPPVVLPATNVQSAIDVLKDRTRAAAIRERVVQQIPIPVGPPEPNLITSSLLVAPLAGEVDFTVLVEVSNGAVSPTLVTLTLRYTVNGGPPVDVWTTLTIFPANGRAGATLIGNTFPDPIAPGDVIRIVVGGSASQVGAQIEKVSFQGRFFPAA